MIKVQLVALHLSAAVLACMMVTEQYIDTRKTDATLRQMFVGNKDDNAWNANHPANDADRVIVGGSGKFNPALKIKRFILPVDGLGYSLIKHAKRAPDCCNMHGEIIAV